MKIKINKLWPISIIICCGNLIGCSHLLYQPTNQLYVTNLKKLNELREEFTFESTDGTKLTGWYFKSRTGKSKGTFVQFHGNGENMSSHFISLLWVIEKGYNLFTFDYRGYGRSEGDPSQEGLNRDAVAAIRYVIRRNKDPLILYGQSLGGAVLLRAFDDIQSEDRERVKTLVIESSFSNYRRIAKDFLSRWWATYIFQPLAYVLVSNAYGPEESIPRVSPVPLLVIHGDKDPIVPLQFGQEIFDLAREPKTFWLIPGGSHIDTMEVEHGKYQAQLLKYLNTLK